MITCFRVTFPNLEVAKSIAHTLLNEKLIACANIHPEMISIYPWEGKIQEEKETVAILKTSPELAATVEARIKTLHPYECPSILHTTLASNPEYNSWLTSNF